MSTREAYLEFPLRRSVATIAGPRCCSAANCTAPARRRGRQCNACSLRAWRKANPHIDRAREARRTFTDEQRQLRNARAAVAMAIKRGRLLPKDCAECDKPGRPHHSDPIQKLEVLWLCNAHRQLQREREMQARQSANERAAMEARASAWQTTRTRFAVEWPHLSLETRRTIESSAKASQLGSLAPSGSPLAKQALIQAFDVWLRER